MSGPKDERDHIPGGAARRLHRLGASRLAVGWRSVPAALPTLPASRRYEATAHMGRGNQITATGQTAAEAVRALTDRVQGGDRKRAAAHNRQNRETMSRLDAAVERLAAEGLTREITPRCSPEHPCAQEDDLHVALYGQCHVAQQETA